LNIVQIELNEILWDTRNCSGECSDTWSEQLNSKLLETAFFYIYPELIAWIAIWSKLKKCTARDLRYLSNPYLILTIAEWLLRIPSHLSSYTATALRYSIKSFLIDVHILNRYWWRCARQRLEKSVVQNSRNCGSGRISGSWYWSYKCRLSGWLLSGSGRDHVCCRCRYRCRHSWRWIYLEKFSRCLLFWDTILTTCWTEVSFKAVSNDQQPYASPK
jgi:hypothetical protein